MHTWLKILVFEKKRCSKLHFTVAQPQLVLSLFLTFDQFGDSCSYRIVLIKKSVIGFKDTFPGQSIIVIQADNFIKQ